MTKGPTTCSFAIVESGYRSPEEEPISGSSAFILNTKLQLIGSLRQDHYITGFTTKDELITELQNVQTNVIFILQRMSDKKGTFFQLFGELSVEKWRGSILPLDLGNGRQVKAIVSYHPDDVMRQWELGAILQYDLQKALRVSDTSEIVEHQENFLIKPTFAEVVDYCNQPFADGVAFDIETSPRGIECLGLAPNKHDAIVIPTTEQYWGSITTLREVLINCQKVLNKPNILKIAQNMTFDIQYLARFFGMVPTPRWYDTMVAQHSCYSELKKSLAFLVSIYTDHPYHKDDMKVWKGNMSDMETLWNYNARDCIRTFEIYEKLDRELDRLDVRTIFNFMMELLEPLLFMMLRGLRVDQKAIDRHMVTSKEELETREKIFKEKFGDVNPNSPKQMLDLIAQLGLKAPTKDGRPTANKAALEKLAVKSPEIAEAINIRAERKTISTYLQVKRDPVDNRFRCSYNSTGTVTGRLSSSASVFGCGNNMQNWAKKHRDIFIPEPGMMITCADLKGAEAMVVAYLANDPFRIKVFETGGNIHTYNATEVFWPDWDTEMIAVDILKAKEEGYMSKYDIAKRGGHGLNYMLSWFGLKELLGISAAESKLLRNNYFMRSPNIVAWHRSVEEKIKKDRTLVTPHGRKRIFLGRINDKLLREAVAFVPQETVATILNKGLVRIYKELCSPYKDVNLLAQVHDEVVLEHPIEMKEEIHAALPELMKVPLTLHGREFSIPIEITSGLNWRDQKDG